MFLAHAAPPVVLGLNEWLFVVGSCLIIFLIMGPAIMRNLRQSGD